MDTIKICTFNGMDNSINRKGGISNASIVSELLKDYDLIGTQEFTKKYLDNVISNLTTYKAYGKYRYGNLLARIPYNETNSIITNQNVVFSKTYHLPFLADNFSDFKTSFVKKSIMPRIATIVVFKTKTEDEICMINTHLDYRVLSIQTRQLSALKKLIIQYSKDYPIILTGDFNMEIDQLADFISSLSEIIKPVSIEGASLTLKNGSLKRVDHIFIPNNYVVEDSGIINSEETSDHNLVFAKIKKK